MKLLTPKFLRAVESLGMVSPRPGNLSSLIHWWGLHLIQWSGKPHRDGYRRTFYSFSATAISILKNHGVNALILRMKVSLIVTQQFIGGQKITDTQPLGVRIRLRNGLPAWLPKSWRSAIRVKSPWVMRVVLSTLNAYKAFEGIYGDPSIASISSEPFSGDLSRWKAFVPKFWAFANYRNIPMIWHQDTPFILTAGPNAPVSTFGAALDAKAWSLQKENWPKRFFEAIGAHEYALMMDMLATRSVPTLGVNKPLETGKLSLKYEAAGKVRVFAICDYWTQAALKPIHDWIFLMLKLIPTDGTFDQEKAVYTLANSGATTFYSYDLKSATDMIPIQLYTSLLEPILGAKLTSLWASLMVDRDFLLPWKRGSRETIRYTRGQPMGAYSSWATLALAHHCLVQYSADLAGVRIPFVAYRVLGDDIVIADSKVAASYVQVCSEFGIGIGLAKSFVSKEAFFNFANQSYLGHENLSPASMKELLVSKKLGLSSLIELASRLHRRGWIGTGVPNVLRLVTPPSLWGRYVTKDFNGALEKSKATLKAIRGALWPTTSLSRVVGTKSSLLVRAWLKALQPSTALLTANEEVLSSIMETPAHMEQRVLYEWMRQQTQRLKKLHEANKTNIVAATRFFEEVSDRLDVGPLITTILWTRDGRAYQRAQKILTRAYQLETASKLPTSLETKGALILEMMNLLNEFPMFPILSDWESVVGLPSKGGSQAAPGAFARQVRRVQKWTELADAAAQRVEPKLD
jgi:hypothetical protein